MILDGGLRPTVIKTNARYRGPSESDKYRNLVGEVVHDLKLLSSFMGGNSYVQGSVGQVDRIWNNMYAYFSGDSSSIYSNVEPGTILYTTLGPAVTSQSLMSSDWSAYGGCTKTGLSDGVELSSDGTQSPSGVKQIIDVVEGDVISIRAKVKKVSGTISFTIGSIDVNQGQGSLQVFALPEDGSASYVQYVFECKHRESITINVDVNRGATAVGAVEVEEVAVFHLEKDDLSLQPINTTIKERVGLLEDEINNILKNI